MEENSGKLFIEEKSTIIDINDLPLEQLTLLKTLVDARILTLKKNDPDLKKKYLGRIFDIASSNIDDRSKEDEIWELKDLFIELFLNDVEDFSMKIFEVRTRGGRKDHFRVKWLWDLYKIELVTNGEDIEFRSVNFYNLHCLEDMMIIPSETVLLNLHKNYKEHKDEFKTEMKRFVTYWLLQENFLDGEGFVKENHPWLKNETLLIRNYC
jgi:hypothetical protein